MACRGGYCRPGCHGLRPCRRSRFGIKSAACPPAFGVRAWHPRWSKLQGRLLPAGPLRVLVGFPGNSRCRLALGLEGRDGGCLLPAAPAPVGEQPGLPGAGSPWACLLVRAKRNGLPKAARIVTLAAGPSALRLDVTTLRTTRLGRGRALAVICLLQFALRLRHDRLNESDFGYCSPEAFSVGFRFAREKSAAESASLRRPQPRRHSPVRPL